MSSDISYQCCFCGETITSTPPDPIVLTLDVEGGGTQDLYAHARCLRSALHPSVPLAVFDDEPPTNNAV